LKHNELAKEHCLSRKQLTSCLLGGVQICFLLRFTNIFLVAYPLVPEPIGYLRTNGNVCSPLVFEEFLRASASLNNFLQLLTVHYL